MKAKELIQQNPYRVMGVSANAPLVLISTQNSWMKAYAAIGKAVYCPHDMTPVFGDSPSRKTGDLAAALAALSTPMSRLTNGMFWFMNLTETDPEAFTILASEGDIKSAVRTWETDPHGMSSLQNRLVCCLLRGSRYYAEALRLASELYTVYGAEFIRRISNGFDVIPPERLMSVFLRDTWKPRQGGGTRRWSAWGTTPSPYSGRKLKQTGSWMLSRRLSPWRNRPKSMCLRTTFGLLTH